MYKKRIFIFSSNKGKIKEIKKFFPKKNFKFYTIKDFKKLKFPKEDGGSFRNNAVIKSKFGFNLSKIPCIADDSGICVDAMSGAPGVNSNRFQKRLGGYGKAINKIIKSTEKMNKNGATFKTVISFTYKKNKTITFSGNKKGVIVKKPIGKNGFGYDSIFKPNGHLKTYAQMSKIEKNSISHRAIAINKFVNFSNKIN